MVALITTLAATQAQALPSFARQTGMDCSGCHIGAFGPQLTPAGIAFKISGYTDSDGQAGKIPLSGMILGSYSRTRAAQDPAPDNLKPNNNYALDQASVFLAGKWTDHVGSLIQLTYDGVGRATSLDQVDVRYARTLSLGEKDTIIGVSLNNNPTAQDPFNTLSVWGFPYVSSPAGFGTGPDATLINGGLSGRVLGASIYSLYDKSFYGELGSYSSITSSVQKMLGLGEDPQKLKGNLYWRLGYMKDLKSQAFHAGVFGWNAGLVPDATVSSQRDKYRDIGVDASYQFLGTRTHIGTVNGSYVNERKIAGDTGEVSRLKETRLNASYYYDQTYGATLGFFNTTGSDPAAATRGQLFQVDWTPWGKEGRAAPGPLSFANLRLGAQYWIYNKYAGDTASAKDHNTLYLFAWTSF